MATPNIWSQDFTITKPFNLLQLDQKSLKCPYTGIIGVVTLHYEKFWLYSTLLVALAITLQY